MILNIKTL